MSHEEPIHLIRSQKGECETCWVASDVRASDVSCGTELCKVVCALGKCLLGLSIGSEVVQTETDDGTTSSVLYPG